VIKTTLEQNKTRTHLMNILSMWVSDLVLVHFQ